MPKQLRIVLAQLNLTVGDISGNLSKLIESANRAKETLSADVIIFPELSLTGYPPEDLLLRESFLAASHKALHTFKSAVSGIYCLIGHPHATSQGVLNSCSLVYDGTIVGRYDKHYLPNYGVFDERRYFIPGNSPCVVPIKGIPIGLLICEDLWHSNPIHQAANLGARLILVPNASPFEIDKHEQRHLTLAKRAKSANLPIAYVNCVGGQDELLFDGGSMIVDATGKICQQAGFFNETLFPSDIEITSTSTVVHEAHFTLPALEQKVYDALVLGLRDYVRKNRIPGALVGVSGGIDSALTLAIAVDALGNDRVEAIVMPSRYTSKESMEDAFAVIQNLNVRQQTFSIEPAFTSFLSTLAVPDSGIVAENIQARCRAILMMAISNKTGNIVLNTSNRSETAVGYTTLYGDMAGGFAVLKDVPKTLVYQLARYRNQIHSVIPDHTINRAPTAELAANQLDQDTLPSYEILDHILEYYLNQEQSLSDIVEQGMDPEVAARVIDLINKNEYKRRQATIGTRINHKAFGRDRRYPITNGFKG